MFLGIDIWKKTLVRFQRSSSTSIRYKILHNLSYIVMVQQALSAETLDLVLRVLLIPVVILTGILLYRLNRIITHGEHSLQAVEDTAENVEESTRSLSDLVHAVGDISNVYRGEEDDK